MQNFYENQLVKNWLAIYFWKAKTKFLKKASQNLDARKFIRKLQLALICMKSPNPDTVPPQLRLCNFPLCYFI